MGFCSKKITGETEVWDWSLRCNVEIQNKKLSKVCSALSILSVVLISCCYTIPQASTKGTASSATKNEIIQRAPLSSHIYCDRQCWKCLTTTQLFAMNRGRIGRQLSTLPM